MSLTLDPINSGYSQVRINENFQAIEDEINNRVLRRDKEVAEPNEMQIDLDLNDNNVLNVNSLDTNALTLNGVPVTTATGGVVEVPSAEFVPSVPAGDLASTNVQAALNELDVEKAPISHTHTESEISDLQAYLLAASLGVTVQPYDATTLVGSDIGTSVQAYSANIPTVVVSQAEAEAGTSTANRTWTPERVSQAIAALSGGGGVGVNQTWQNLIGSRAFGVTYTNTTGSPIEVSVAGTNGLNSVYTVIIGGVTVTYGGQYSNGSWGGTFIVPDQTTYNLPTYGTLTNWDELR